MSESDREEFYRKNFVRIQKPPESLFFPQTISAAKRFLLSAHQLSPRSSKSDSATPLPSRGPDHPQPEGEMVCHGCHGAQGGGAHSGSLTGKHMCHLPHSNDCPGGRLEDETWRACPPGFTHHLGTGLGATCLPDPSSVQLDQMQLSTAVVTPQISPMINEFGNLQLEATGAIPRTMERRPSIFPLDTGIPTAFQSLPQGTIPQDMEQQVAALRAVNQQQTESSAAEQDMLTIAKIRGTPDLSGTVEDSLSNFRQRMPSLNSAPNAPVPQLTQTPDTTSHQSTPYSYDGNQLYRVTGDGVRVTSTVQQGMMGLVNPPITGFAPLSSSSTTGLFVPPLPPTISCPSQIATNWAAQTPVSSSINVTAPMFTHLSAPPALSTIAPCVTSWTVPTVPTTAAALPPLDTVSQGLQQQIALLQQQAAQVERQTQLELQKKVLMQAQAKAQAEEQARVQAQARSDQHTQLAALLQQEQQRVAAAAARLQVSRSALDQQGSQLSQTRQHVSQYNSLAQTPQQPTIQVPADNIPVRSFPVQGASPYTPEYDFFLGPDGKPFKVMRNPAPHSQPLPARVEYCYDQWGKLTQVPVPVTQMSQYQYQPGQATAAVPGTPQIPPQFQPVAPSYLPTQPAYQQPLVQFAQQQTHHLDVPAIPGQQPVQVDTNQSVVLEKMKGIVSLVEKGETTKKLKLIDYVRNNPAKWAKKCTSDNVNLPGYFYGAVNELISSLSGRADSMSPEVLLSKLHHLQNVAQICCQNSTAQDFTGYGWTLARDYAFKVQDEVDQKLSDWRSMPSGVQTAHWPNVSIPDLPLNSQVP